MTTIRKVTEKDFKTIERIGKISIELAHRDSCSVKDMNEFLRVHYNEDVIRHELENPNNIYYLISYNGEPAGFSKVLFNAAHPNIQEENVTKLDRIYLLPEFYDLQLGYQLLLFNINLSNKNNQAGMWLFTWTGNERAVRFYKKAGFTVIASHSFRITDTHYNPNYQMYLKY